MNKIIGKFNGCATGAFVNGFENLNNFQKMIDKKLAVVHWYLYWGDPFPKEEADLVFQNGSIPLITWEPWIVNPAGVLASIISAKYANYISDFIQAAKDWGRPVLLRFAHEMNGNWYPWDGAHNGGPAAPEKYREAWVSIYNVKKRLGAENVKLVWSPNNVNLPETDWNKISNYFPGEEYVDWLAMDGYNWGYEKWQDFEAVFETVYQTLIALAKKPLMIAEFAAAEHGGAKAAWIKAAFRVIKKEYPRIKLACWFNINKERDWRIDSSVASKLAYQATISDSYFSHSLL